MKTIGGPSPEVDRVDGPVGQLDPALVLAPVDPQPGGTVPAAVAVRVNQGVIEAWVAVIGWISSQAVMRIALDIDSTLHHYWALFADAARAALRRAPALRRAVGVGDRAAAARAAQGRDRRDPPRREHHRREPYPGAVETVRAWHDAGHFIHVTSHRAEGCAKATEAWLADIGLRLRRALLLVGQGHPLLRDRASTCSIDDSPVNLEQALDAGIAHRDHLPPLEPRDLRDGRRALRRRLGRAPGRAGAAPRARAGRRRPAGPDRVAERRTSLREVEREDGGVLAPWPGRPSPPRCRPSASGSPRDLLPGVETERQVTDWGRSERVEGAARPHRRRVPLPLLVPRRGRGDRARPGRRRRAARLQPLRRAAARRRDDRQGDPRGAPARPAAPPHRRALLQGLSGLLHAGPEDRRRRGAPGQRAPAAVGRAAARARVPRGPQGHREARQGPATACAASAAAASSRRPCAPARRSSRSPSSAAEEAAPVFAQLELLQKLTGLLYFPITPTFPHFGILGMFGYLPAKFRIRFLPPVPDRRPRRAAVARQGPRPGDRPRHPRPDPGAARRHGRRAPERVAGLTG